MILGELIGLIALPTMWILFIISILGIVHEMKMGWDRPILDFIYVVFFSTGFVVGTVLLVWFFIATGLGESIGLFLNNLWNMQV